MKINKLCSIILIGLLFFSISSCAATGTSTDSTNSSGTGASNSQGALAVEVGLLLQDEEGSLLDRSELFTNRDLEQTADLRQVAELALKSGEDILIDESGVYVLTGDVRNTVIMVDAGDDAKVQLLLDNLKIINEDLPAIYVKSADKVFITTQESKNSLIVSEAYIKDGDTNLDAVIFSRSDLVFNGVGTLEITSSRGNGISTKDDLKITGGTLIIEAYEDGLEANDSIRIYNGNISIEAGEDAMHSEDKDDPLSGFIYILNGSLDISAGDDGIRGNSIVQIDGGIINIDTSREGIEATQIQLNGGIINVYATDDGINATSKSSLDVVIIVNAGDISVTMAAGDTDAFDSNGDMYIYGGNIDINARSSFDADGTAQLLGGTVMVNGSLVTEIPQGQGQGRMGHGKRR